MLFPTVSFAAFLVIVLIISWWLRPHPRIWRCWLLLASWIFYGWWDWRFVMLLMAVIGTSRLVGKAMVGDRLAARVRDVIAVDWPLPDVEE